MPTLIEGEFQKVSERALVCTKEFRDTLTAEKLEALLTSRPGSIVEVSPDFIIIERQS